MNIKIIISFFSVLLISFPVFADEANVNKWEAFTDGTWITKGNVQQFLDKQGRLRGEMWTDKEKNLKIEKYYWQDGRLKQETTTNTVTYEQSQKTYWSNGNIKTDSIMIMGQKAGEFRWYDENGKLVEKAALKEGKLINTYNACNKSIQFVFGRWSPDDRQSTNQAKLRIKNFYSPEGLENFHSPKAIKAFTMGSKLTNEEIGLLEQNNVQGFIEIEGSGGISQACDSGRIVFIVQNIANFVGEFNLPKNSDILYVQKDNTWEKYPADAVMSDRNVTFKLSSQKNIVEYSAKNATGGSNGGSVYFPW